MKKIFIFLFLLLSSPASAEVVDIYCPKCHKFLWELKYENPLTTDQFKTENILKGEPSVKLICPLDGTPINGWEYWAWERNMYPPQMVYPALTVMTLNDSGDFVWFPHEVIVSDI